MRGYPAGKSVLLGLTAVLVLAASYVFTPAPAAECAGKAHAAKKSTAIQRSAKAKRAFMKATGYPKGRPGYVVHHVVPLSKGGSDEPSNMAWVTIKEHKRIHGRR